jgi:hypothetical protein
LLYAASSGVQWACEIRPGHGEQAALRDAD